ncbi:uncharacterized protein LOC132750268 isoform X2 [Ruditapes philippinarum]|uniref:uncharacterized protein LOC132750268 isoform X2 n=1 Tax=Ruditapes philippinarum TaxID=129788 RepID=UPI00295A8A6C|nr:uncharacterized protein LOC132750268 isoform X2 [Ruditapes philippinarum]
MSSSSESSINSISVTSSKVGQTTLQTSSDVPYTDSTQFPMQHPTQMLPSNQIPIATTDPVSATSTEVQGQASQSIQSGNMQSSLSSVSDTTQMAQDSKSLIPTKSSVDESPAADKNDSVLVSSVDDNSKSSSGDINTSKDGVTNSQSDSVSSTDIVAPSTSKADILPSKSESSVVMTGVVYSTNKPTTFSSAAQGLDTMSLKTTEAVTPPTGKPMVPEASGNSTILGGGLSDNIIYIGVPLCGLGILILLILCIVCIRRKKSKAKGSPAKNRVQDLWVNNSRQDIPLTSRNALPEQNSGEAALQDDIGCTTYEAVFDYKGELSTHLQLKQGDLVRVHRKEAAGWWRGTAGDQTGWFPSNYVQAAPPDNFKTENEVEMHDDSYVSSFMVKRSEEPNQRQSCLLNELNQRKSYLVNEPNHRKSAPTEEEIQAEPIYCKIQPKDKRKSGVDRSNSTTPTKSDIISSIKDTSLDEDTHYVALYPFVARVDTELTINKGDIILCKECGDQNGWMRGINDSTKLEGWVPATYVKKVGKVEKVEKPKLDLDPSSYKQLEVNVDMDERQDLVGIVHKAIHTFSAEKAGDLEFDTGDHITVFQVLENGWWLGCKDKTVGWFPGTFVEMIDQPSASPSPSPASSNQSPSQSPVPSEDSQPLLNDVPKNLQQSDVKPATQSKLKPVRKAPAPPTPKSPKSSEPHETDTNVPQVEKKPESKLPTPGGSRLPKMSRPKVAPPLPPTKHSTDLHDPLYDVIDKPDHKNDVNTNISDKHVPNNNDSNIVKQNGPTSDGLYELIKPPENGPNCVSTPKKKEKIKPPVPKRFIKPKLVTVPKAEVQMQIKRL